MEPASPAVERISILIIDDDPGAIQILRKALPEYPDLRFATNGDDGLRMARDMAPDLILLDAEMPGLDGFEALRLLKSDEVLADIPVIFVTGHQSMPLEILALELGAADFLSKPVHPGLVRARVRSQVRIKQLADQLREMAARDGLTSLGNRRALDERLRREWRRCLRSAKPLSVLLLDVDHFKLFNDSCGHMAGDDALRRVGAALAAAFQRPGDFVARYGGEEFMVVAPETEQAGAIEMAEQILRLVRDLAIRHPAAPGKLITVSIGVSTFVPPKGVPDSSLVAHTEYLVGSADKALYQAKSGGRNRVAYSACEPPMPADADAEAVTSAPA